MGRRYPSEDVGPGDSGCPDGNRHLVVGYYHQDNNYPVGEDYHCYDDNPLPDNIVVVVIVGVTHDHVTDIPEGLPVLVNFGHC